MMLPDYDRCDKPRKMGCVAVNRNHTNELTLPRQCDTGKTSRKNKAGCDRCDKVRHIGLVAVNYIQSLHLTKPRQCDSEKVPERMLLGHRLSYDVSMSKKTALRRREPTWVPKGIAICKNPAPVREHHTPVDRRSYDSKHSEALSTIYSLSYCRTQVNSMAINGLTTTMVIWHGMSHLRTSPFDYRSFLSGCFSVTHCRTPLKHMLCNVITATSPFCRGMTRRRTNRGNLWQR